jgi:hypothetical protein
MNNTAVSINSDLLCCGLTELGGINRYRNEHNMEQLAIDVLLECDEDHANDDYDVYLPNVPVAAHIIFTQASGSRKRNGYGYDLANYIEHRGLGLVTAVFPARNPNTTNYIHTFVWEPNRRGIAAWAKQLNRQAKANSSKSVASLNR